MKTKQSEFSCSKCGSKFNVAGKRRKRLGPKQQPDENGHSIRNNNKTTTSICQARF